MSVQNNKVFVEYRLLGSLDHKKVDNSTEKVEKQWRIYHILVSEDILVLEEI